MDIKFYKENLVERYQLFGRPEHNFKPDLKEIGCEGVDRIQQDRV